MAAVKNVYFFVRYTALNVISTSWGLNVEQNLNLAKQTPFVLHNIDISWIKFLLSVMSPAPLGQKWAADHHPPPAADSIVLVHSFSHAV